MQGFKEITFKGSLEHFIEKVKNLITGFFGFNTNERVSYERAINNRKQCQHDIDSARHSKNKMFYLLMPSHNKIISQPIDVVLRSLTLQNDS